MEHEAGPGQHGDAASINLFEAVCSVDDAARGTFIHTLPVECQAALRLACKSGRKLVDEHIQSLNVNIDTRNKEWRRDVERLAAVSARWPRCTSLALRVCVERGTGEAALLQALRVVDEAGALRTVDTLVLKAYTYVRCSSSADKQFPAYRFDKNHRRGKSVESEDASFSIRPYELTDVGAAALVSLLPALQDLTLGEGLTVKPAASGAVYGCLARAAQLRRLRIPACIYADDHVAQLQGLRELHLLDFAGLPRPGAPPPQPDPLLQLLMDLHPQQIEQMPTEELDQMLSAALEQYPPIPTLEDVLQHIATRREDRGAADQAPPFLPGAHVLPQLSVLGLEGVSGNPMVLRALLGGLPAGVKTLRVRNFNALLPRLLGQEPQWQEPSPFSSYPPPQYKGDFLLDLESGTLQVAKASSLEYLAQFLHGVTQACDVRHATVAELTLTPERALIPELARAHHASTTLTGACAGAVAYLSSFAATRELTIRAGVCGFKAGTQLLELLRRACRVSRLVLHGHGSQESAPLEEFVRTLARELPAGRLPEQLCVSGYLDGPEALRDALEAWPPLRALVALVHFERRAPSAPAHAQWSGFGYSDDVGCGWRPSRGAGGALVGGPPAPAKYAAALRYAAGKVRQDGWCAVPCRTDAGFEPALLAALGDGLPFRVRVVEHRSRKWAVAAASEGVLVAACEQVCEFTQ